MWSNTTENAYPSIILHDCRVTKVLIDDNDIIFQFDDGFWVTEKSSHNPYHKTLRTYKSEIRFKDIDVDFSGIYYFKTFCLFKKTLFTRRIELAIEEFATQINSGKWEFEIVDELYAWRRTGFNGYVYFNKKPYDYECQIHLFFQTMIYSWDKICEDKPW